MNTKRIAVTGSNGQVGRRLMETLRRHYAGAEIIPLDRPTFDLNGPEALQEKLSLLDPELIFHAGAYTQVDQAESDRETCARINRDATLSIGTWCAEQSVPLVFFSTDYVFSGGSDFPYTPDSPLDPVNWYGKSKAEAEAGLEQLGVTAMIIRTQWVYDSRGKNFLETMLHLMRAREDISVVDDQIGSPTYAKDLAEVTIELVESWLDWGNPGMIVRHVTNQGHTTWNEFATKIQEEALRLNLLKKPVQIKKIPTSQYPTPAARPLRGWLDLKETLREGVSIRDWKEALHECMTEKSNESR